MSESKLLDVTGQPIQTRTIDVIKFREFSLPIRVLKEEDAVSPNSQGVKPMDMLRELRAGYMEMRDRFVILGTVLAAAAEADPDGPIAKAMNEMGIVLTDYHGKTIFEPKGDSPV